MRPIALNLLKRRILFSLTPSSRIRSLSDSTIILGLVGALSLLSLPLLGIMEFSRHTEADRALIAWEMLESGNYLVPHLFGDVILTKPPLYYWLLSTTYWIFGEISEFTSRLPSFAMLAALAIAQYLTLRAQSWKKEDALVSCLVLITSAQVLIYSFKAEIDLSYAALCSFSLFAWMLRRPFITGVFLATALLTKGPPALVLFFAFILGEFIFYERKPSFKSHLRLLGLALSAASIFVGTWFLLLSMQVGFTALIEVAHTEFIQRFLLDPGTSTPTKAWWFYLARFPAGLLPGVLLLTLPILFSKEANWKSDYFYTQKFFVIALYIAIFSLASGKASRYLLPIYPIASIWLVESMREKSFYLTRRDFVLILLSICLLVRVPYTTVYGTYQNNTRSVREIAAEIHTELPPTEPVYVLELFERWICFYLKKSGRNTLRVTPAIAQSWEREERFVTLLLNLEEEGWRIEELRSKGGDALIQHSWIKKGIAYTLVRIKAKDLNLLSLQSDFPTSPTPQIKQKLTS